MIPVTFGDFLGEFEREYVEREDLLAVSTRRKYRCHLKNHIRPAFGGLAMAEVTARRIDAWLGQKAKDGMAWATRCDLRNLLSCAFTVATRWDLWTGRNPAQFVSVGRPRPVRTHQKLTTADTQLLLGKLPEDVRLIAMVALFCGLRISEVLGLCWRHIDLEAGVCMVRQRYYRGDLDLTKTGRSTRDVPLGFLTGVLGRMHPGTAASDTYVFSALGRRGPTRRDDSIRKFLIRTAKEIGIHQPGFGFHSLRREAITAMARYADPFQAMRTAGHTRMTMTLAYGLGDHERQEAAVRQFQTDVGLGLMGL